LHSKKTGRTLVKMLEMTDSTRRCTEAETSLEGTSKGGKKEV